MKTKPTNCTCQECGKTFHRKPSEIKLNIFCSRICAQKRNKKAPIYCDICGNVVDQKRRAKYCSKLCANRAIKINPRKARSTRPRTWKKILILDRGGKCNRCTVDFVEILQVHHIIERSNGGGDELENLEILCPTCHAIHHYSKRIKK